MSKVYEFKELVECPKCLTERQFADVKWGPYTGDGTLVTVGAIYVLKVQCANCGFAWLEQPADAEPKVATSDEFRR